MRSVRAPRLARVQIKMPSFPLTSAGASRGSNFGQSWSFQTAAEKELQERQAACQEERVIGLVKSQRKIFRHQNLIKDVIKALCFLKLL